LVELGKKLVVLLDLGHQTVDFGRGTRGGCSVRERLARRSLEQVVVMVVVVEEQVV
jgi:hypothetical protein